MLIGILQFLRLMMDFEWSDLEPKLNNWLELNLRYGGMGSAEFVSPEGTVQGKGTANFDEYGNATVEIECESFSIDPQYTGGPVGFLFGSKVEEAQGKKTMAFGEFNNPCKTLSIRTAEGVFRASSTVRLVGWSFNMLAPSSGVLAEQSPLRFYVQQASYDVGNPNPPRYFAIPLFNCLAEGHDGLLRPHPLRIYETPEVPSSVPETDKIFATMKANQKNVLVGFFIEGRLCFVERLADYDDRVAALKNGALRRITAVLVGELGDRPASTLAEFWSWFPFELFSALSFASGVEVGLPWIEIRDEAGGLTRRLHGRSSLPHFWGGDPVLGQFARAGTQSAVGNLLTQYLSVSAPQRSYLEVAMDHARLGTLGAPLRLYDILDHLIRALECLCREHGFIQQDLLSGLADETQNKVKSVIAQATKQIQQLQNEAIAAGLLEEHRLLSTIQGRAANIGTTEQKFGLGVVSLLKSLGLHDADILDRFIASNPRRDGLRDWASVLTSYRGATIHEGYMDFGKKYDVNDVARVCNHLKDLIARLILKETGYEGSYDSPLLRKYGPQPVGWVLPVTSADRLGFT
jgi:hypothetical protein